MSQGSAYGILLRCVTQYGAGHIQLDSETLVLAGGHHYMIINDPETHAQVTSAFSLYEQALMENDVATLDALFWNSPHVLRYGVGENLHGIEMIRAFRNARAGGSPQRVLRNTVITTFGRDFGTANTEFLREKSTLVGRQSQTWVRLPQGWRITAAHVSMMSTSS